MTNDQALEIISSSLQYRELIEALEEAEKQFSPDEWREVSQALMNDVDAFVAQRLEELSKGEEGNTFRA